MEVGTKGRLDLRLRQLARHDGPGPGLAGRMAGEAAAGSRVRQAEHDQRQQRPRSLAGSEPKSGPARRAADDTTLSLRPGGTAGVATRVKKRSTVFARSTHGVRRRMRRRRT